jgi:hypothetical protein
VTVEAIVSEAIAARVASLRVPVRAYRAVCALLQLECEDHSYGPLSARYNGTDYDGSKWYVEVRCAA